MVPPEINFGPDDLEAEMMRFMVLPMVAADPGCKCSCHNNGTMLTNHVVACCDGAGVPKDWQP